MKLSTSISTALKFNIVLISFVLFNQLPSQACGPDFMGWQYTFLLEHYTFNHPYFNYQFDPNNRFYSLSWQDGEEVDKNYRDDARYNLDSWRAYLQLPAAVHDTDLKAFIYRTSLKDMQRFAHSPADAGTIGKCIQLRPNAPDVWQYLSLVKTYQEMIAPPQDMWEYSSYTQTLSADTVNPYVAECESQMKKTNDAFLQWRLLYLVLRASHLQKYHALAREKFEQYYPQFSKDNSLAQYWCEGMYAGALLRLKQYDKSIYYTARAFANCPDQQMQAMNTYLFGNREWRSALPYCKSAADSVAVALLEGANHTLPDMTFIDLVYRTNPQSDVLKLLWLREAKKAEEFLFNNEPYQGKRLFYLNYDNAIDMDSMYTASKTLLRFMSLSETILNDKANILVKVTVGHTAAFYYYRQGDWVKAAACLDKIAALPKDETEKLQFRLLSSLINLKKKNAFDTNAITSLIEDFRKIPEGHTNHHIGYYVLFNELAPHFLQAKDTSTAFWIYTYANAYDAESFGLYAQDISPESFNHANFATWLLNQQYSIEQVTQLKKQYLQRKGKDAFETWLINKTKLLDGQKLFNLVIARKHMLNEQWADAIKEFDELPEVYRNQMGPNPANFSVNDYIETDDKEAQKNTFTVRQILELAQKLKTNADSQASKFARDKLLYATLLYNLSFYGKNHYILDNHWNHSQSRTPYFAYDSTESHLFVNGKDVYTLPLHKSYQNYFHLQIAEKYLNDALGQLATDEEKARCLFLLAKCWQKRCPKVMTFNKEYGYMEDLSDYVGHSKQNPFFVNIAGMYKHTKLQEQVFNSCSYYRMYLGKK